MRTYDIKVEYFSKYILFTTIYLLQEEKINHINCSGQEIDIRNFLQPTEHYVHMYEKFGGFIFYVFLLLITPKIDL
jgi:hypothetical protein